jgi:hypothetical protein
MLKSARTKILIYLAVWKRPAITELCFRGIDRLKTHPDFEINTLAVISEESAIELCEEYGVNWVMYKNEPLGEIDFDYLMEIGSDDLITNDLLEDYKKYIGKHDFFGIRDAAYVNSETGECRRLTSKATYGAGRMISRKALELIDWKLWVDRLNCGMDNNSVFNLGRKGVKYVTAEPMEFPGVIDVKSEENIWHFNYFIGIEYDLEKVLSKISQAERDSLIGMIHAEV